MAISGAIPAARGVFTTPLWYQRYNNCEAHKRRVLRFRVCVASQSARDSAAAAAQGISLMEEKKRWRRRHKQINVVPFNNREKIKFSSTSSSSPAAPQNRTTYFCSADERKSVFAWSFEFDSARAATEWIKTSAFTRVKDLFALCVLFAISILTHDFLQMILCWLSISNELLHSI